MRGVAEKELSGSLSRFLAHMLSSWCLVAWTDISSSSKSQIFTLIHHVRSSLGNICRYFGAFSFIHKSLHLLSLLCCVVLEIDSGEWNRGTSELLKDGFSQVDIHRNIHELSFSWMAFKAYVRHPPPYPLLDLLPPSLPTSFLWMRKYICGGSTWWCRWPQPLNAECLHGVCWKLNLGTSMLERGQCPSSITSLVSLLIQAGAHSQSWRKPRSDLKRDWELCALFLATRA